VPTPEKQAVVARLKERLEAAGSFYLCEYGGLSVKSMNELRSNIIGVGGLMEVVKNRLLRIALEEREVGAARDHLEGPTAIAFCGEDETAPARVMKDFAKTLTDGKRRWEIKAAFVGGRFFAGKQAMALADLPPIAEIKASAVGAIAGPVNGLVFTLNGALGDLVRTLDAVADKRKAEGI
jgi:large subunit ribosomal protein L10